jgi:hypothetical protein
MGNTYSVGSLERVNVNGWTTPTILITAVQILEARKCRNETAGKVAVNVAFRHA